MKAQLAIVLFVVSCLTVITSQDYGEVYCGRRLATALALLCDYNLIKRSDTHVIGTSHEDSGWPWIDHHRAHGMGRSKRQVITECCDKPCTVNELLSYCAN